MLTVLHQAMTWTIFSTYPCSCPAVGAHSRLRRRMTGVRLAVCGLAAGVALGTLTDTVPSREPLMVDGYEVLSGDFHVHAFVGDGGISPWMCSVRQPASGST